MYETLLRLWNEGRLTETQLDSAAAKGWITSEQKQTIKTPQ